MKSPAQILIADDNPANLDIFRTRLTSQGYDVLTAADGEAALAAAREHHPDLILLDIMMPKMDGIEVCRRLKADAGLPFMPIILVTAKSDAIDVVKGLEAGAEEYLTKPVDQTALVARVKSMLRIKALYDQTQDQAGRLEVQAGELAEWNRTLEERVAAQLVELERVGQLKRFFSPHLADLIVSSGDEKVLESHRREIVAVFCDLRRFTAFSETAEPEEVMQVLREYHGAVGPLIFRYEATLEHFAGDGIVSFFNDPVPCPDPAARAVRMAVEMQCEVGCLVERWSRRGHDLALGLGLATGYATMGQIGFESLFHYGAIGSVLNTASRLCDTARDGQILISRRVAAEVEEIAELEPLGELELRGFRKPIPVYNVTGLKDGGS
ncbi:MAG: response regulator [Rhodospirillales bacterium]|nr:response regulator [Rhodospirillales bacterium]